MGGVQWFCHLHTQDPQYNGVDGPYNRLRRAIGLPLSG